MPPPTHDRAAAVHSLPSFAQAFSSLSSTDDRALPPIHGHHRAHQHHREREHLTHSTRENDARSPPMRHPPATGLRPAPPSSSRPPLNRHNSSGSSVPAKRPRAPSTSASAVRNDRDDDGYESSGSDDSPPPNPPPSNRTIKSEHTDTYDRLSQSASPPRHPPPRPKPTQSHHEHAPLPITSSPLAYTLSGGAAPPPSLARPPSKRRRFTVSGAAHPLSHSLGLNTSNLTPASSSPSLNAVGAGSTPISPVVMGFTIQEDNPTAIEQVRSMLSVKQKQKALIESRRGSIAGLGDGAVNASPPSLGKRGSTAGLQGDMLARRGSLPALQVTPTVHIVNPPPPPSNSSSKPQVLPPKRNTGPSPNGVPHRLTSGAPSQVAPTSVAFAPSMTVGSNAPAPNPTVNPTTSPNLRQGVTSGPARSSSGAGAPRAGSPANHVVSSQNPHARLYHSHSNPQQRSPPNATVQMHAPQNQQQHLPLPPSASQSAGGKQAQHQQQQNQSQAQTPSQSQVQLATQGLTALANALPPPPTSFASRRASQHGGRGNKPADIVVMSPRDADAATSARASASATSGRTPNQPQTQLQQAPTRNQGQAPSQPIRSRSTYLALQPSIQSAPAVPRPGHPVGRFPAMALPSLPPAIGQPQAQTGRVAAGSGTNVGARKPLMPGQVPPTPTRLTMQRAQGTNESVSVRLSQPVSTVTASGGSSLAVPRTATFLQMPVTPATSFHATARTEGAAATSTATATGSVSGTLGPSAVEKHAFLAPFEQFYDALADARVLKGWFGEQLTRVGTVVKEVEAQKAELTRMREEVVAARADGALDKEAMNKAVAEAIAEATKGFKDEVMWLRKRVSDLDGALGKPGPSNHTVEPMDVEGETALRPPVNGISAYARPTAPLGRANGNESGNVDKDANGGSANGAPGAAAVQQEYSTGVDSYTFPPIPAPTAIPSSAATKAGSVFPARPSSAANAMNKPSPEVARLQRSVSPLVRTASTVRRSPSRSDASSPAPSYDAGRGRTHSISAMRYELPASSQPKVKTEEEAVIEKDRGEKATTKKSTAAEAGTAATGTKFVAPKGKVSPVQQRQTRMTSSSSPTLMEES